MTESTTFVAEIKDTQYGQRVTFENGEHAFNYQNLAIEVDCRVKLTKYDKGEDQEWMNDEFPIGEDGRVYLSALAPITNSTLNRLRMKNLTREYEIMELALTV